MLLSLIIEPLVFVAIITLTFSLGVLLGMFASSLYKKYKEDDCPCEYESYDSDEDEEDEDDEKGEES